MADWFPLFTANKDHAGISAFDINFEDRPRGDLTESAQFFLKLSPPHLDQVTIWMVAGEREVVLWDGRGGSDDGGFDDDTENDSNITLNRVLSSELRGVPLSGHWTLYVSNASSEAAGTLEGFWLTVSVLPRVSDFVVESSTSPAAGPTVDFAAQRAYLKTAAQGAGSEVTFPALGQTVYLTFDWQLTGASGSVTLLERALLDGSTFCSFSGALPNGAYVSSCNSGWVVSSGAHTVEWDLDYNNSVAEVNESNNTAVLGFSPTGLDVVAKRAYLRTAAGSGSEVVALALGQTVYFTGDWQINGAGSALAISQRAVLDGSQFCGSTSTLGNGNWTTWCANGWSATAGSHTLRWDFDYTNQLPEINESNNSTTNLFTTAGVDIAAQRAYLLTGPGSGSEVLVPQLGQTVYITADWLVTGASSSIVVPQRVLLDGTSYCTFNSTVTSGNWTSWCNNGWVATGGTHTLEWDLDYNYSLPETNENNNVTVATITTAGSDILAQRAYLRTAAGSGNEVTSPSLGQTVYFTVDWLLSGAIGTLNVPQQAVLDGSPFCTFTVAVTAGSWTSWCTGSWVATPGTHTLEWDLDYTRSIAEINETNNQAIVYEKNIEHTRFQAPQQAAVSAASRWCIPTAGVCKRSAPRFRSG